MTQQLDARRFRVIGTRPDGIPADWTIWNAPRPLSGQQTWQGEWQFGNYYAATDPACLLTAGYTRGNIRHDAVILADFITKEQALAEIDPHFSEMQREWFSVKQRLSDWKQLYGEVRS